MKTKYQCIKISDTHYRISEEIVFMDLLIGADKALLIDTGYGFGNLKAFVREITDKPLIVVNTHGHPDHSCANWQFAETVWIGEADLEPCRMYTAPETMAVNIPAEKADDFLEEAFLRGGTGNLSFTIEGQIFDLGGMQLEVVNLPGHTKGSIGLMDRAGRQLFVGDAMNSATFLFQTGVSASLGVYRQTLQKVLDLPVDKLWLGHGAVPVDKETSVHKFLKCAETVDFRHAFRCGEMMGVADVRLHVLPENRPLIDPGDIMGSVYGKQLVNQPDFSSIFISADTLT